MEESAKNKLMVAYDPISWLRVREGKCWFGHYYWMNRKILYEYTRSYTIYTNQYTNLTFAHHLSLCSSMVRASHRRSEGYGFDSRQGLKKFFWENSFRACILRKILSLKQRRNMRLSDRIEIMPFQFLSSFFKYSYHGFSRWCCFVYVLCSNF